MGKRKREKYRIKNLQNFMGMKRKENFDPAIRDEKEKGKIAVRKVTEDRRKRRQDNKMKRERNRLKRASKKEKTWSTERLASWLTTTYGEEVPKKHKVW